MRSIRKYESLNSFLILICHSIIFFSEKMIKCFSLPNLRVFNTDAVPTETGKSFQVQKAAEYAMAASHCSHIHDVHLQLPQMWVHQSPNLLHLGANSPCLECLQLPGEVHNFSLIFWSSRMQLPSLCSPRVWPTLQQCEESPWGLICKQQGQK